MFARLSPDTEIIIMPSIIMYFMPQDISVPLCIGHPYSYQCGVCCSLADHLLSAANKEHLGMEYENAWSVTVWLVCIATVSSFCYQDMVCLLVMYFEVHLDMLPRKLWNSCVWEIQPMYRAPPSSFILILKLHIQPLVSGQYQCFRGGWKLDRMCSLAGVKRDH